MAHISIAKELKWLLTAILLALILPPAVFSQTNGEWQMSGATSLRQGLGAPTPRNGMVGVWLGSSLFVFGGHQGGSSGIVNNGGIYSVPADTWLSRPNLNGGVGAPSARSQAFAIWTGSVIVVWGGGYFVNGGPDMRSDGGIYDPATDTWTLHPGLQAPSSVAPAQIPNNNGGGLAALHDGKMIVFGGLTYIGAGPYKAPSGVYTGGVFDLALGAWVPAGQLEIPVPPQQFRGAPVYTGTTFIARGDDVGYSIHYPPSLGGTASAGDVFDLKTMTWRNNPTIRSGQHVPARHSVVAVWTGEYRIEWAGAYTPSTSVGSIFVSDGNIYDPASDQFLQQPAMTGGLAGYERAAHQMAWTGSHMFGWGGRAQLPPTGGILPPLGNGALYDPVAGVWITGGALNQSVDAPSPRSDHLLVSAGDRVVVFGGTSAVGQNNVRTNTGGIYIPPRSAPVIRSLDPGEPGTASNPLAARAGAKFRHRIVCYGCPEAALVSLNLPSWLHIGWGGPSGLGPSPGTSGFVPWFSAEGGTCDGQWLRGTPSPNDTGLHSFTARATNGVGQDTADATVWIRVEGPPKIVNPAGSPTGPRSIAIENDYWFYSIQTLSEPGPTTITVTGMPGWMTFNPAFNYLDGTPTAAHLNTTSTITLTVTNGFVPPVGSGLSNTVSHNFTVTVATAQPVSDQVADLNGDLAVNVLDVQLLAGWIVNAIVPPSPTPANPNPGDVTGDARVDVIDMQALINRILGR